MKNIDINCDVGEGAKIEEHIMPYIQSCSIACGGHAGDADSMKSAVQLALKHQVKIGAHPSYPDRVNFGRKSMQMESEKLIDSLRNQIEDLIRVIEEQGGRLHHIKPHGALYNDLAINEDLAGVFLKAILPFKQSIALYVPYNSIIAKQAKELGFSILFEAFADRAYADDMSLVSRNEKGAVITSAEEVYSQVSDMFYSNTIETRSNKRLIIEADTYCVHSDTENAVEIVAYLHHKFLENKSI
jgi:UPF0271 protein